MRVSNVALRVRAGGKEITATVLADIRSTMMYRAPTLQDLVYRDYVAFPTSDTKDYRITDILVNGRSHVPNFGGYNG